MSQEKTINRGESSTSQVKQIAEAVSQERLIADVYSMWIDTAEIVTQVKPGQFISVYTKDGAKLLLRSIGICGVDKEVGTLRTVYRVVGAGTEEFAGHAVGYDISIMGPLGNGFPEIVPEKRAFLIGGGIGISPMLELAKQLTRNKQMILGYRDQLFLNHEFEPYGDVFVATEDGNAGTKDNVLDTIREQGLKADVTLACGPTPMLHAIKVYAMEQGMECYLSLEERMTCGAGACLACICQSKDVDDHSHMHNKRICKNGPVSRAEEVEL